MTWSATAVMLLCCLACVAEKFRAKKVPPFLEGEGTFIGKSDGLASPQI
jgi:hypothetical protein